MPQPGSLIVRAYVSRGELPVRDASVILSVPEEDGRRRLLSVLLTNESGRAGPVQLPAPDAAESLTPQPGEEPFAGYTLLVEHPDYQLALFEGVQVFAGEETVQDVPLIPLSPDPERRDLTLVTPQPL